MTCAKVRGGHYWLAKCLWEKMVAAGCGHAFRLSARAGVRSTREGADPGPAKVAQGPRMGGVRSVTKSAAWRARLGRRKQGARNMEGEGGDGEGDRKVSGRCASCTRGRAVNGAAALASILGLGAGPTKPCSILFFPLL